MCGICGEMTFDGRPVAAEDVARMADAIAHRGPDDAGAHVAGGIGLGHRRLSIIDLSPKGRQPMWTDDGRMAIVFNGEVYNFQEIREELAAKGYRFESATDTEVVLKAVHCWGAASAATRFIGMFAFAIWDAEEGCLWLVRDRAGVKPLFYYRGPDAILFGSELKALAAHPRFSRGLSDRGLHQFFVTGYFLGDATVYRDTFRVPAGHVLRVGRDGGTALSRYWSLDAVTRGAFAGGFERAAEELAALAESAFGYRLISDVPVGLFLSGGIDSTFLAAVLKRRLEADLLHITIGFRERAFDESPKAKAVAEQLGVRHVVRHVEAPDARKSLLEFVEIYDEPFGDTSGIPTAILSRVAREHVKVALSADGGDEQFCGYESYPSYANGFARAHRLPGFARRLTSVALGRLVPYRPLLSAWSALRGSGGIRPQVVARYEKLVGLLAADTPADLIRLMNAKGWMPGTTAGLLGSIVDDALAGTVLDTAARPADRDELVDLMMRTDYAAFLGDDILTKVDRASMAVSLECRDPFLDHRLAELAFSLPLEYLWHAGEHKRILKHLLRPWIGPEVLSAPKRGFAIPLYEWLRGPWKPLVMEHLSPGRVRAVGVLDARRVQAEVDQFYRHRGRRAERVMLMLNFQMWAERWLRA